MNYRIHPGKIPAIWCYREGVISPLLRQEKRFLADLLMVALVPVALWPLILVFLLKDRSHKRVARSWPATRGRVDHVDVDWMVGRDCYYAAQVGYTYQVGGRRYSGSLASRGWLRSNVASAPGLSQPQ